MRFHRWCRWSAWFDVGCQCPHTRWIYWFDSVYCLPSSPTSDKDKKEEKGRDWTDENERNERQRCKGRPIHQFLMLINEHECLDEAALLNSPLSGSSLVSREGSFCLLRFGANLSMDDFLIAFKSRECWGATKQVCSQKPGRLSWNSWIYKVFLRSRHCFSFW